MAPEEEEEKQDTIQRCWRCEELNEADDAFCSRCGAALDEETAATLEKQVDMGVKQSYRETPPEDEDMKSKLDTLDELLEDPEVKEALLEKIER